jgi:hypothetical protein
MNGRRKCGVHTQKGELFINKKNGIVLFSGKWMKLEIIVSNKINHTQKDKYHMSS